MLFSFMLFFFIGLCRIRMLNALNPPPLAAGVELHGLTGPEGKGF